ncbi:protein-disulfide reductase DsbD [Balneatrix alpica]|uniref:Thiol:disulfide interchange protein DsbD n=1 Tax=Balneatrix alpica TaxID=75684 RepID=A0ABV5Z763_9GAMM|nr:protein-disulfide reductase DsbD [Balneatrix alpica]
MFARLVGLIGLVLVLPSWAGLFSSQAEGPLEVEQAYQFSAVQQGNQLILNWLITDGYYLYRDKVELSNPGPVLLLERRYPPSQSKDDPLFGQVEVYYQEVTLEVDMASALSGPADDVIKVTYQGCWEGGICYPPVSKEVKVSQVAPLAAGAGLANSQAVLQTNAAQGSAGQVLPQGQGVTPPPATVSALSSSSNWWQAGQFEFVSLLERQPWWLVLAIFFVAGLGLALTPCVFPMLPILSSILAGQRQLTAWRGFCLALVYVVSMALTYTSAGVIAGLFGANIQVWLQMPGVLLLTALFFLLFALAMFGVFNLQMPNAIQSYLTELSQRQRGGSWRGVAVMGVLSALIMGPCVAAPLAGALLFIGQQGDPWLGGAALFVLSMGMGVPLLVLGGSAGHWLPRAGAWMHKVKQAFGVLLLFMAWWILARLLDATLSMALLGLLLVVSMFALGVVGRPSASGWGRTWQALGLLLAFYGVLLLVGAAAGGHNVLKPLQPFAGGGAAGVSAARQGLAFKLVSTQAQLDAELLQAAQEGKPVMLDFYADWCISCKELEYFVFSDAQVVNAFADVHLVKIDLTANTAEHSQMYQHYRLIGPPALAFYGADGQYRPELTWAGVLTAEQLLALRGRL